MKVLAIIDVAPGADMQTVRGSLLEELRGSWRLYKDDVLREAYATTTPARVVFVLEAASAAEAERHLATMPLVLAGLVKTEFLELKPFANWSMLFKE